jgi:hypothetical protein
VAQSRGHIVCITHPTFAGTYQDGEWIGKIGVMGLRYVGSTIQLPPTLRMRSHRTFAASRVEAGTRTR